MLKSERNKISTNLLLSITLLVMIGVCAAEEGVKESSEDPGYSEWLTHSNNLRGNSNLVLYYNFEEDKDLKVANKALGLDIEGYKAEELNGTVINNARWTDGRWKGKKGLHFDEESYIELINSKVIKDVYQSTGSMEMWLKPDSVWTGDGKNHFIFDPSGYPHWSLYKSDNEDRLSFFLGTSATSPISGWGWRADQWYHLVITWANAGKEANGMLLIYVNGKDYPHYSTGKEIKMPALQSHTRIGRGYGGKGIDGIIDEVAVFNRVLTKEEIEDHYQKGKP